MLGKLGHRVHYVIAVPRVHHNSCPSSSNYFSATLSSFISSDVFSYGGGGAFVTFANKMECTIFIHT